MKPQITLLSKFIYLFFKNLIYHNLSSFFLCFESTPLKTFNCFICNTIFLKAFVIAIAYAFFILIQPTKLKNSMYFMEPSIVRLLVYKKTIYRLYFLADNAETEKNLKVLLIKATISLGAEVVGEI